mgnify:CR=1 FL=1
MSESRLIVSAAGRPAESASERRRRRQVGRPGNRWAWPRLEAINPARARPGWAGATMGGRAVRACAP